MWLRSRGTGMICATVISERPYPGLHCQYHVQRRWHPAQGPIMVELNVGCKSRSKKATVHTSKQQKTWSAVD